MIFRIAISLISLILAYFLPDFLPDCFMILPDFFRVIPVGGVAPHYTPHNFKILKQSACKRRIQMSPHRCLTKNLVYQAFISADNREPKIYIGMTA